MSMLKSFKIRLEKWFKKMKVLTFNFDLHKHVEFSFLKKKAKNIKINVCKDLANSK